MLHKSQTSESFDKDHHRLFWKQAKNRETSTMQLLTSLFLLTVFYEYIKISCTDSCMAYVVRYNALDRKQHEPLSR